jgi:hypothetical protein
MIRKAALIITHPNPDLDAIGFVYSAHKVFGSKVPVECRMPTQEELKDPTVIVGDIGLPGYEDIGYNPALNNFDHHYSHADRSATFLFNEEYHTLRQDIVKYIDAVDLRRQVEESEHSLQVAIAGIRVRHDEADLKILEEGGKLLKWLEKTGQKPEDLSGALPDKFQEYLQTGIDALRQIRKDSEAMQKHRTQKGRLVGYVQTPFPIFSMVKEEMFARGIDIAVVHNPEKRRFSIASSVSGGKGANLKAEGLIEALNQAEWGKGLPHDQGWGGHEDRIGSPKPSGSLLTSEEVLAIVKATL